MKFSVVISVYKNDNPDFFRLALDSLLVHQTRKPSEIVLIVDGPVPFKLNEVINEYIINYGDIFKVIRLKENRGLGNALQIGVINASFDIIARMDSDDISLPNRFIKQLAYLEKHSECDIVGGQCTEFIGEPDNIVSQGHMPLKNDEIYNYMRTRCGMSHVTVMFRKAAVLKAGNYQDWFYNEDYYLWIRMMIINCRFANIPDICVNVRTGVDQYKRRGGIKYFKSEEGLQRLMLNNGIINRQLYLSNVFKRFIVQIMIPNCMRGWFIRTFAR